MRRNSWLPGLACLLSLVTSAQADEEGLAGLMARLAKHTHREAFFVEERYAFYLNAPLKTQGRLKAVPPDRLEKTIVEPEPIQQVITGNRIIQSQNGVTVREVSLGRMPVLAVAINTLRAVVFGNMAYLEKTFDLQYQNHEQQWTLVLVPQDKKIQQQIKSIKVTGANDNINEFLITEANGDYSKTRLYEHQN